MNFGILDEIRIRIFRFVNLHYTLKVLSRNFPRLTTLTIGKQEGRRTDLITTLSKVRSLIQHEYSTEIPIFDVGLLLLFLSNFHGLRDYK